MRGFFNSHLALKKAHGCDGSQHQCAAEELKTGHRFAEQNPRKYCCGHGLDQQPDRGLSRWDAAQRMGDGSLPKDLRDQRQPDEPNPVCGRRWKQLLASQRNQGKQHQTTQERACESQGGCRGALASHRYNDQVDRVKSRGEYGKASPDSLCGPARNEGLLSRVIPRKANSPHPIVLERIGRRRKDHEKSGTSNTAQLASKVAFVTDVRRIEKCHAVKSRANAKPASQTKGARKVSKGDEASFCSLINIHSTGTARAILQNAVAIGPVVASRTKIGANPIAIAPAASKRNKRVIAQCVSRSGASSVDVRRTQRPARGCRRPACRKNADACCEWRRTKEARRPSLRSRRTLSELTNVRCPMAML